MLRAGQSAMRSLWNKQLNGGDVREALSFSFMELIQCETKESFPRMSTSTPSFHV